MTVFSIVQQVQLETEPRMDSELMCLTVTHTIRNITYHMLEIVLALTYSVLRHAWYHANRLLHTVGSPFLEIAVMVCLWCLLSLPCVSGFRFSVGRPTCCDVIILLRRIIVCKAEITSCRSGKLICEVWAPSRWRQCCVSLAATFALWWLDLSSLHLQIIRYVDIRCVAVNLQVTYEELKRVERVIWMWELNVWL